MKKLSKFQKQELELDGITVLVLITAFALIAFVGWYAIILIFKFLSWIL
jgi:hypothetical protein